MTHGSRHSTINIDEEIGITFSTQIHKLLKTLHAIAEKALTRKAGLNCHHRNHVDIFGKRHNMVNTLRRIYNNSGVHSGFSNLRNQSTADICTVCMK